MPRYFLEVAYKGTAYSGFQLQANANTIQAEVEKALQVLSKYAISLTGSSRTDAGVHAYQNFFHFDIVESVNKWSGITAEEQLVYKLNAILPADIAVQRLWEVSAEAHCRFDAVSRTYNYCIYSQKSPFKNDRAYYFPYKLDIEKMKEAASVIKEYTDFTTFSKRNTQVKTFNCQIIDSEWMELNDQLIYKVTANRFLRGMVRALTATMLQVGRGKMSLEEFRAVIEVKDCTKASFAVPAHGLFLIQVTFPTTW